MTDFRRHLAEQMLDSQPANEYDRHRPEYKIMRFIFVARTEHNMSLEELSKRSVLRPSNLRRLGQGEGNPTITTLQYLAKAFGKNLHIEFR